MHFIFLLKVIILENECQISLIQILVLPKKFNFFPGRKTKNTLPPPDHTASEFLIFRWEQKQFLTILSLLTVVSFLLLPSASSAAQLLVFYGDSPSAVALFPTVCKKFRLSIAANISANCQHNTIHQSYCQVKAKQEEEAVLGHVEHQPQNYPHRATKSAFKAAVFKQFPA